MTTDAVTWLFGLEQFGIKFGLDNIRTILDALGHPERAFRTVHIAGTNGKGSVTAMVDAALRAAGHRTARYTSPHLVHLRERFVIDGRPVDDAALENTVGELRQTVDRLRQSGALDVHPTFFEVTTAVAFELFRRAAVTVAVCEVGLGGRLDATNVLEPVVTAITSIGLDHQQYLGGTLRDVAGEKAGIIKRGVPVVVGRMDPEAREAIVRTARERQAPIVDAWQDVSVEEVRLKPDPTHGRPDATGDRQHTVVRLRTPRHDYGRVELALPGAHQIDNAIVAVRVLELTNDAGIETAAAAIASGLEHVVWPGRLDVRRLPDGREALLDAAHNADGAAALAAFLKTSSFRGCPLVFAAMRDKDIDAILRTLAPMTGDVIATTTSNVRSADVNTISERMKAINSEARVSLAPSPREALAAAWRRSPRIIVAGSIFLLGDVMKDAGWS